MSPKEKSEFFCDVHVTTVSFLIAVITSVASIATIPLWLSTDKEEYQALVAYNMTWIFCALLMIIGLTRKMPALLYLYNMMLILHVILFAITTVVFTMLTAMIPTFAYLPHALVSLFIALTCGLMATITADAQLHISGLLDKVVSQKRSIEYVKA
uniref:PGG domain-containing protein n=1 Tax=Steinernema glaseri TaxID=37863 RepID=A0A1I7YWE7_9BILA